MKSKITKLALTLSAVGLSTSLFAQSMNSDTTKRFDKKHFRTWSIGLNGGMLTHFTPFNSAANGDFRTPEETWGYGAYVKKQILPGFGIQGDFLAGKVRGYQANSLPSPTVAQNNSSFTTNIEYAGSLSGNFTIANMSLNHKRSVLSPYFTAGAGYMSYSSNVQGVATTEAGYYRQNWFVPVGAGLKFGLSKTINIDLGYNVYFMKTPTFDGVRGANNDRFSYAHAGLEFSLGRKSSSQLANYSPIAALREESAAEAAELKNMLAMSEANRMREEQAIKDQYAKDLADDDADGVANKFDKCPGTPAGTAVDGSGCALPVNKPDVKVYVTEEDKKVVKEAIKDLEFDLGKAVIRDHSFASLDRVANLLVSKNFSLKLAGHTDNTGSAELNMRLSKDRAESVKDYLVSKGANASRIEAVGYGQTQPIATNKTAAGRQQNRRVEFTLY
ncbi:MAG: OmpA family protein [Sphingobacteriaceae bacterium]|nr:MAG: OmpA family protein [Sphingobacteriaceae bacterium]